MPDRHGAAPEAWRHYSTTLGLTADLLPVVSNPNATISPTSKMRALGKTPSRYNQARQVSGIPDWTSIEATSADIARWSKEPDYGICIQTRRLRAIDIDVEGYEQARAVGKVVARALGEGLPVRHRNNSEKILIPFWYDQPLSKHVIPVAGGMVEILADGQQFIAEGHHSAGARYEWIGTIEDSPVLDEVDFAMLLADLSAIAIGPVRIAHQRRAGGNGATIETDDEVLTWLLEHWEVHDHGQDGQIFIACPFAAEHSTDTGPSSTAYFPAGSGGYAEGNFVCLHAHCTGRSNAEFLNATGFTAGSFDDLGDSGVGNGDARQRALLSATDGGGDDGRRLPEPEQASPILDNRAERQALIAEERWPTFQRTKAGEILPTMNNLLLGIAAPFLTGRRVAHDAFRDELVWSPYRVEPPQWRPFRDIDYPLVRQQLELRGMKPMGQDLLRSALHAVAQHEAMDTAIEWIDRLSWDGRPRVDDFAIRGWGWGPSDYAVAVSQYVWTALAGRILEPGCQADMAPILVGPQGCGKSSAVRAMAPDDEFYTTIKLTDRDADISRRMRGRLVVELEELRGLNSRAIEEIKAFITLRHEEWVPKFKEFSTRFRRRLLFMGTTNDEEFLADPSGERRWLPGRCTAIDVPWIIANREQLWAEGAARFMTGGIAWQEAERLAAKEHSRFKIVDGWVPAVQRWLAQDEGLGGGKPLDKGYVTTEAALTQAIGLPASRIDRATEIRMGKLLRGLGLDRVHRRAGDTLEWRYESPLG